MDTGQGLHHRTPPIPHPVSPLTLCDIVSHDVPEAEEER